jgi:hypothetical protein
MESSKSELKRGRDIEFRFFSESKQSEKIESNQKKLENAEFGSNRFKRQCPTMEEEVEIESKKRVKLN